tara:strand:+ start:110 stop:1861 length:1752 start_codon:yes stop_codon:yes gene_type:complete
MRKLFILILTFSTFNIFSQNSFTFTVDMNLYTGVYNDVQFNRGTQFYNMVDIGNNYYQYTISIPPFQQGQYTYKFCVDSVCENMINLSNCYSINPTTGDTLRSINLNINLPDTVCWQSCSSCIIYGCTNSNSSNFNPLATNDDGSCIPCIYGCTDSTAINYDSLATCNDTCIFPVIGGCMDTIACNYNVLATYDDGSCGYILGCLDTSAFNYDSLATCSDSSCIYEYNVTFQLDLRGVTNINYINPELNGIFNGWCGNCAQMTDNNNDSIWEITIPLLEGSGPNPNALGWEYKFSADNWTIQEELFEGDHCVVGTPPYINRYIYVTQDTILPPVCWGGCNDCYTPRLAYNVTFRLDMSNALSSFTTPEVNGLFNNWCGSCWQMEDINNDNIWEFTTLVDTNLQEYKFSADNWSIQEELDSSLNCVITTLDSSLSLGYAVNRYFTINSDTVLDVFCWEQCNSCSFVQKTWDCDGNGNCYDPQDGSGTFTDSISCLNYCTTPNFVANNYKKLSIYPNPSSGDFSVSTNENIEKLVLLDIFGKQVDFDVERKSNGFHNIKIKSTGTFFLKINLKGMSITKKIFVIK